jgi:hypothetical protein
LRAPCWTNAVGLCTEKAEIPALTCAEPENAAAGTRHSAVDHPGGKGNAGRTAPSAGPGGESPRRPASSRASSLPYYRGTRAQQASSPTRLREGGPRVLSAGELGWDADRAPGGREPLRLMSVPGWAAVKRVGEPKWLYLASERAPREGREARNGLPSCVSDSRHLLARPERVSGCALRAGRTLSGFARKKQRYQL